MLTVSRRLATQRFFNHTFRALIVHRNFRLYWLGALLSNMGTWIQTVAQGWLVYDLTGSALYLGIVSFSAAIPSLFLSLLGGVLADRFERRRLMLFTQTGSMLLAFALAYLAISHTVTVWQVIVIAFLNGIVFSLNTPVRQTIISDLVTKEDLTNAIALNSMQFQGSRMLGPALAGIIVAITGPGWCFFINGLSFLAVILALLAIEVPPLTSGKAGATFWAHMVEGVRYVRGEPTILALLGLVAIPNLFAMPYTALMPAFAAKGVLDAGAEGLGLLMSAAGLGALIGATAVASLGRDIPRGRLMLGAVTGFGVFLALFAASRLLVVSLALLVVVGLSSMMLNSLNMAALQTLAEDRLRGRVMSLLTLSTFGLQPLGTLLAGALADRTSAPTAVLVGGLVTVLYALWIFAKRPTIRQLR